MQGTMNLPQGHFMGLNAMPSGSLSTSGAPPPVGSFPNGLPNMQGPSNASGPQMYPQGGMFNRSQGGQMSMMPGYNPYQVIWRGLLPLLTAHYIYIEIKKVVMVSAL
jgi:polyadenylation factor subunit 2